VNYQKDQGAEAGRLFMLRPAQKSDGIIKALEKLDALLS